MSDFESKTEDKSEVAADAALGPQTFGTWLKAQRLAKKVPLEEIAAVTKIHLRQLKCLEEGWGDTPLPASAFIRGFVVSYARYLNLDESEVLDQFTKHAGEFKERSNVYIKTPTPQTYTSNSGKPLRFGSYSERKENKLHLTHWVSTRRVLYAIVVILGFALLIFLMKLGRKASETPAATNAQVEVSGDLSPQPQQTQIVDKDSPAHLANLFLGTPPFEFLLQASEDNWINLKVDENSLESFKLSKAEARKIVFNRRAVLTLSNVKQFVITLDGKAYKIAAPTSGGSLDKLILPEQSARLVPYVAPATVNAAPAAEAPKAPAPTTAPKTDGNN